MASSLLRSAARELRRSIPPPRPTCRPLMEGLPPRLLSTDSSCNHHHHKMSPSSSPNSTRSLLENVFRSDCAERMDTSKKQFSKDDIMEFNRYMRERTKQSCRDLLLSLDKFSDACENRTCLLRDIKVTLEASNKRSAQKYLLVKQWAVLISYSFVFALAIYNLHLFS